MIENITVKDINGKYYMSGMDAARFIGVSYKTIERWTISGTVNILQRTEDGSFKRRPLDFRIDHMQTPTGFRYYGVESIEQLKLLIEELGPKKQ